MSNLAPLPESALAGIKWIGATPSYPLFTAEQMRAYAAEAVAKERTARQEAQHRVADLQERINKADRDLALAVAKERERCAKLCEGMHPEDGPYAYAWVIRTEWASDSDGPGRRDSQGLT